MKILLLDDNLDILQVIEEVLIYGGFEVITTIKSAGFIELAESCRPDLVILDYKLADGDGGELCRSLKAHPLFKGTPVIFCTAYSRPGLDLFEFGCDELIDKPFDLDELLWVIHKVLGTANSAVSA